MSKNGIYIMEPVSMQHLYLYFQ